MAKKFNIPETAVGLCAGRHDIPVSRYIFSEVSNVMDFPALNKIAGEFILANCNIRDGWGSSPAQTDYTDVQRLFGDPLDVVVTGLTPCTAAVMWACACYGVRLTLWHYNRDTGDYVPQQFDF